MSTCYPLFISYRRSDLSLEAEWLASWLRQCFGDEAVFFDREEIAGGTRWDDTLRRCVHEARIVLVLIGPAWLQAHAPSGQRRLDDEQDWVRQEVQAALQRHGQQPTLTRVFPVLVNGAGLPPREWLPAALAELASQQLEPDLNFDVRDYLDAAIRIQACLQAEMAALGLGLPGGAAGVPVLSRERVPNPYDLPDFPLPERLRLRRPQQPFRGLTHFRDEDAAIFFGRSRDIAACIDRFRKGHRVMRLFGQSGVGKSSFLFAGLLPRLQGRDWQVHYVRRDAQGHTPACVAEALQACAAQPLRDALLIVDQLEEALAPRDGDMSQELIQLARLAAELEALNADRARPLRLIWAYRKEFDANLRAALREQRVTSTEYWLQELDREGLREAIVGLTRDRDLQAEYRLEIETGLDDLILSDLLGSGPRDTVAPMLQVLLRRMWDRVEAGSGARRFDRVAWQACRSDDVLRLIETQLDSIGMRGPALREAVDSGLALDLLQRLVTEQDSSASLAMSDLLAAYASSAPVTALAAQLVDHYLAVREDGPRLRLAHDTLARPVRLLHARSVRSGQRASRLLDSKAHDIEHAPTGVDFSHADLLTLDEGAAGMRCWSEAEVQAVASSRARREREAFDLREANAQLSAALQAERQSAQEARSNLLNLQANQEADLTRAMQLALQAVHTSPTQVALATLYRCHDRAFAAAVGQPPRRWLAPRAEVLAKVHGGRELLFAPLAGEGRLFLLDLETLHTRELLRLGATLKLLRTSAHAPLALVACEAQEAAVFDLASGRRLHGTGCSDIDQAVFVDARRLMFHSRHRLMQLDLESGAVRTLLEMPQQELIFTFSDDPAGDAVLLATRERHLYRHVLGSGELQLLWESPSIVHELLPLGPAQFLLGDFRRAVYRLDLQQSQLTRMQEANEADVLRGQFLAATAEGWQAFTQAEDEDCIEVWRGEDHFQLRCERGDYFSALVLLPERGQVITAGFRGLASWPLRRSCEPRVPGVQGKGFARLQGHGDLALQLVDGRLQITALATGAARSLSLPLAEPDAWKVGNDGRWLFAWLGGQRGLMVDLTSGHHEEMDLPMAVDVLRVEVGSGAVWLSDTDGGLHRWDIVPRRWRHLDAGQLVYRLAFDGDDRMALGLADGTVLVSRTDDPLVPTARWRKLSKPLLCLTWSPDGRWLCAGGWNSFAVLCAPDGTQARRLAHAHWVIHAAFSPDGQQLATVCQDGSVSIWDVASGARMREGRPCADADACCFSAGGDALLVTSHGHHAVVRWSLPTAQAIEAEWRSLGILDEHMGHLAASAALPAPADDPLTPYVEDLPPQINLGGVSIVAAPALSSG